MRFPITPTVLALMLVPMAGSTPAQGPAPPSGSPPASGPTTGPVRPTPASQPASAASRRRAERDAEPTVLSAEAAAKLRPKADRYGRPVDPPAYRRAQFFNLQAEGRFFIFVVDRSGSMDNFDRFERAKRELLRSIGGLQPGQSFFVIFHNEHATPMPGEVPRTAGSTARVELARWLDRVETFGGTDPRGALALALGMRPDGIFLLSDGDYPPGTAARAAALNPGRIPIHCVDLSGGAGGTDLRTIAEQSGGQYSGTRR